MRRPASGSRTVRRGTTSAGSATGGTEDPGLQRGTLPKPALAGYRSNQNYSENWAPGPLAARVRLPHAPPRMSPDVVLGIAALTCFGIHPVIAGSKLRSVLV